MWLFIVFLAVPLIEIGLFIQVGGFIGLWPTLGIVIVTALLGTVLMRSQGLMAINNVRSSITDMRDPTEPLAHGAMILFAGALLLTPGFFTDAVGFSFLIPPVRTAIIGHVKKRIKTTGFGPNGPTTQQSPHSDTIIDVEYEELDPNQSNNTPGNSGWTKD